MDLISDDENDQIALNINTSFAEKYEEKKKKEELSNLKEKYGDQVEDDESSSEIEDEFGELVTPEIDAQIMKTISLIKSKEPIVYDSQATFFDSKSLQQAQEQFMQKKQEKPLHLKDYHRMQLLNESNQQDDAQLNEQDKSKLSIVQEQELLKKQVTQAFHESVQQTETDDLLTLREKSMQEKQLEEEEYKNFLLQHLDTDKAEALKEWKEFKENKSVDPNEAFLMDYILTRGWIDPEANKIPSYQEIVNDSEDEEAVEAAEEFENRYNFRFEEEQGAQLMTYSRTIDSSIRRKEDKRKRMRERKLERKALEKTKKDEELKRLKNLKKEELRERLLKIQEMAGGDILGLDEMDLEKDFDPKEFDEKMTRAFNDEYYDGKEHGKPEFESDIEIDDIIQSNEQDKTKESPNELKEQEPTRESIQKKTLNEYLDDVYQLNYEDIVAGIPTRFKYRTVEKQDFGLDANEILMLDEKNLNEFVSLKKLAPYRPPEKVSKDKKSFKKHKKKKLKELRQLLQETEEKEPKVNEPLKKKRKREAAKGDSKGISKERMASYA